uniref:Lipase_3 domain-containing protein n=1 Tax=Macrostomum lignano TaxID=282301 RepID=A0A1I8JLI0_9PLAT
AVRRDPDVGLLQRHPRLRICLAHGAGSLPYTIGRIDSRPRRPGRTWPPNVCPTAGLWGSALPTEEPASLRCRCRTASPVIAQHPCSAKRQMKIYTRTAASAIPFRSERFPYGISQGIGKLGLTSYTSELPPLRQFILPSWAVRLELGCTLLGAVCRRAERIVSLFVATLPVALLVALPWTLRSASVSTSGSASGGTSGSTSWHGISGGTSSGLALPSSGGTSGGASASLRTVGLRLRPSPTPPPQDGDRRSSAAVGTLSEANPTATGPDGRSRFWTNLLIAHFFRRGDERSVNGGGSAPANGALKDDLVYSTLEDILSDQLIDVERERLPEPVIMAALQLHGHTAPFSTQVFASPAGTAMDGQGQQGGDHLSPTFVFSIHNYGRFIYRLGGCSRLLQLICASKLVASRPAGLPAVHLVPRPSSRRSSCACAVPGKADAASPQVRRASRAAEAGPPTPESELATTLATQNYHQQQLDYPSDEVEAGPRRTRRFSGTNRQQLAATAARTRQFRGSRQAPSRVGQCRLASLVTRQECCRRYDGFLNSAAATVGAVASNAEVESRGIEEELDDRKAPAAASGGQACALASKSAARASSIGLSACLTCVSLPWHRIVCADLLDSRGGLKQQPVLAAFEDLPNY